MKRALSTLALALASALPVAAASSTYALDPDHSEVGFTIRHLVSDVRGRFNEFSADIVKHDADPGLSSVVFRIRAESIDTNNAKRDEHLRSSDFFDVTKHPEIVFKSTRIERVAEDQYRVTGPLAIRGISKVITLPVSFVGEVRDPWGGVRAGFSTAIELDRKEFGITWNKDLDNGGLLLGDKVSIVIDLGAKKQG